MSFHRVFPVVFVLLGFVIIGCQGFNANPSKPIVIITSPPSGSVYNQGEEVQVQSTSTDPNGVVKVELYVDDKLVRADPSPVTQGQAQFSVIQGWSADAVGSHTVTVRATNAQNVTAESGILVDVRESTGENPTAIIGIATAVPLATSTRRSTSAPQEPSTVPDTPVPECTNNAGFVADVSIPDGTVFTQGAVFTKVWRVQNSGTCSWDESYSLVFLSGSRMSESAVYPVPPTAPGDTADLAVPMAAPSQYGSFKGTWRIRDGNGQFFGTTVTVLIAVPAPATPVPPTPIPTKVPPTQAPAACNGRPNDFTFTASKTSINSGEDVEINWTAVTNASAVFLSGGEFDNSGVETPGKRTVSPDATTTYTIVATCTSSGQSRQKQVTITVGGGGGGGNNFAGQWIMNFGSISIVQSGNAVAGTYQNSFAGDNGTIEGTISGSTLNGTLDGGDQSFKLTITGDGKRLDGNGEGVKWCGARPGSNFADGCSFAGKWKILIGSATCNMTLQRHDDKVTGNYSGGDCTGAVGNVNGTVSYPGGNRTTLNGTYKRNNTEDSLIWILNGYTALSFRGSHEPGTEAWCGWRQDTEPPDPCSN